MNENKMIKKKIKKRNKTVIITHINADFDAVGSLLAAQKLYPEAVVVFPEISERTLKHFFVNTVSYLFKLTDVKKLDFAEIKKIIIVDTAHSSRIGQFKEIINEKDIEIIIYDHHPQQQSDIKADKTIVKPLGSTVTILTDILKEKNIYISAEEATIMCLGIFEDTGSFNFTSTCSEDFMAAAWLKKSGANLKVISSIISKEMRAEEVALLNDMLYSSVLYNINGIEVIVTMVSTEKYVQGFAYLVMKMASMENLDVIFALARMGNKIYITARSSTDDVNVGEIMSLMGGGGHHSAAAATIKNKTLAQTENELIDILYKNIKSTRLAKDLMSSPAISVSSDVSCKEAAHLLTRYNINTVLVTNKENKITKPIGLISRQIIEKALYHNLGDIAVSEYMTDDIVSIEADVDLFEVQRKLIDHNQRLLPILENGNLKGVITRTDLLDSLLRLSLKKNMDKNPFYSQVNVKEKNIKSFMRERLSNEIFDLLENIGKTADKQGFKAYVVGGFVRDMFLYRDNQDIDIVIEGDGIAFAKKFAAKMEARVNIHEKFGTAIVIFKDGFKIDVASARLEYYKFPAALPDVMMSSIKLDLFRRDFTINTLAIKLCQDKFGTLFDFFSARKDIKEKMIRVLHNLSFVEDPTRVFRAIMFEQRFGFTIGKLTTGLIKNAVKMDFFNRLSGERVFAELKYILEEKKPISALQRMNDFNLIKVIHPSIKFNKNMIDLFTSTDEVVAWHDLLFLNEKYAKWALYFLSLINECKEKEAEGICKRFSITFYYKNIFTKKRIKANKSAHDLYIHIKNNKLKNSVIYKILSNFETELILYIMAIAQDERVKKAVSDYYTKLRQIKVYITGNDLKKMGFKPSPLFSKIKKAVFEAKLDGAIKTKEDEIEFIKNKYEPQFI
jgi:tRNA nucleotidyltransferase (CCA-adding enzyme)